MKNLLILVAMLSLISLPVLSQKNTPDIVKKEFANKYSAAQSVKWSSEEADEWEAEFSMNGKKMSACFDNDGKWIESETAITEKELPEAIITALNRDFNGFKKGPAEIYESLTIKGFEMSLKNGEKSVEVIFDSKGTVLKKTDLKEEGEKEDEKED
jgi:hypothetical protein